MKKLLLSLFTLSAVCLSANAQAETAEAVDVTKVTGTYNCDLYLSIGEPIPAEAEAFPDTPVSLEEGAKAGTVNFAIYNLYLGEDLGSLGDIVLPNVGLLEAGEGKYTFAENAPVRLKLSVMGNPVDADVHINKETSHIEGGKLYADVDISWIGGFDGVNDVPIYVRVVGPKKDEAGVKGVKVGKAAAAGAVYTLNGVRATRAGKGVYIIGGKKVAVK